MVKKKMYQKIQTCKRQGLLKAEISRKLELDPRTVAKYYEMSEEDYREYLKKHNYRFKVFSTYREDVLAVYRLNGNAKLNVTSREYAKVGGLRSRLACIFAFAKIMAKPNLGEAAG